MGGGWWWLDDLNRGCRRRIIIIITSRRNLVTIERGVNFAIVVGIVIGVEISIDGFAAPFETGFAGDLNSDPTQCQSHYCYHCCRHCPHLSALLCSVFALLSDVNIWWWTNNRGIWWRWTSDFDSYGCHKIKMFITIFFYFPIKRSPFFILFEFNVWEHFNTYV